MSLMGFGTMAGVPLMSFRSMAGVRVIVVAVIVVAVIMMPVIVMCVGRRRRVRLQIRDLMADLIKGVGLILKLSGELALEILSGAAKFIQKFADGARHFRQLFGADKNQRDDAEQNHMGEA